MSYHYLISELKLIINKLNNTRQLNIDNSYIISVSIKKLIKELG